MRAYVIKNKEGKYLSIASQNYEHYWTTLDFAYYFRFLPNVDAKELADDFKNSRYPDCEVVEIIIEEKKDYDVIEKYIAEVKRLKKEIIILKATLLKASKEAFGNRVSFVSSNYPKKITNSVEYAEYLLSETEKEIKDGNK